MASVSVLTAVEALVPTLEVHNELAAVVHKHTERPGMEERLKDAMACAQAPRHFASACNDRAKDSALSLASAVWAVTQGAVRSGYSAAQAQYKAACTGAPEEGAAAAGVGRKAWATLTSGGVYLRASSVAACTLLGARGGNMIFDAARASLAGATGWAGDFALPVAMPLAGLVGAAAFEIHTLSRTVRTALETPETQVLARLREEMEGGPVRLPEKHSGPRGESQSV